VWRGRAALPLSTLTRVKIRALHRSLHLAVHDLDIMYLN
jgi:hypothetical protein